MRASALQAMLLRSVVLADWPIADLVAVHRYPCQQVMDWDGGCSDADTTVLALAEGISFQALGAGEGGVVLKVRSGRLFTCNDTTSAFLAAVDGRRSFAGALVQALLDEFEVAEEDLRGDLAALAGELTMQGIVRVQ